MSKATLEFSLPEELDDFELAMDGAKYAAAIFEIMSHMRNAIKYEELPEPTHEYITKLRAEFFRILDSLDLDV